MTEINDILHKIAVAEGGFVDNPIDRGGPTKYGVTLKTLQRYNKGAVLNDLKNMDVEKAKEIFLNNYFIKPKIDKLPEFLHYIMLDMSINHGPINAVKILQNALIKYGYITEPDGYLGPNTNKIAEEACDSLNDNVLITIVNTRNDFYKNIVINDYSQKIFLKGWLNRSNKFMPDIKNVDKLVNKEIFRKRLEEVFRDRTGE